MRGSRYGWSSVSRPFSDEFIRVVLNSRSSPKLFDFLDPDRRCTDVRTLSNHDRRYAIGPLTSSIHGKSFIFIFFFFSAADRFHTDVLSPSFRDRHRASPRLRVRAREPHVHAERPGRGHRSAPVPVVHRRRKRCVRGM